MEVVEDYVDNVDQSKNVEEVKEEKKQDEPVDVPILIQDYKNGVQFVLSCKNNASARALMGHSLILNILQSASKHYNVNNVKELLNLDNDDENLKKLKDFQEDINDEYLDVDICNIPEFVKHCLKIIYNKNKEKYQSNEEKISRNDFIKNNFNMMV